MNESNLTWHTHHTTQQRAQHRLNNESAPPHTTRTHKPRRAHQPTTKAPSSSLPLSLSHTQPTQQRATALAEGTTQQHSSHPRPPPHQQQQQRPTNHPRTPTKTPPRPTTNKTRQQPTLSPQTRAHAQRTLWKTKSNTFQKTQRPPKTRHTQPTPVNNHHRAGTHKQSGLVGKFESKTTTPQQNTTPTPHNQHPSTTTIAQERTNNLG